ncbi:5050_t:CDS:2 [Funneliformis geosporum]|uniref:5050_t:CDS:1 n=1 Tax=Funneliformis geosporum TaxID=1117311 RepID=A0A9W4WL38_9GLOM|nr:5050_t:CDS:2 [Funneliformis geosporum]
MALTNVGKIHDKFLRNMTSLEEAFPGSLMASYFGTNANGDISKFEISQI